MSSHYEQPYFETCFGEDEDNVGPRHSVYAATPATEKPNHISPKQAIAKAVITKFIPPPLLKQALDRWLPTPQDNVPIANKRMLRDAHFPMIQELLMQYGKRQWSLLPRTFAVLHMLGCPELLDQFVAQKRSDSFLPYSPSNLPNAIRGALRAKFLKLQQMVLCKQKEVAELEAGGKHIHLDAPGDNYFEPIELLGRGFSGAVDRVRSRQTLEQYARKLIYRGPSVDSDSRGYRQFEGEIQALKKLSHPHIVKLVGSYTDPENLGLIMTPIADMNLHEYLTSPQQNPILRKRSLPEFFGCLATALAYLHQQGVRHNDIKPKNVLVKDSKVYLTDFGTSRSWGAEEVSTTIGLHEGFTERFSAPETYDTNGPRNRASDMWSLGCVFLEMATVLMDHTLQDLDQFLSQNGNLHFNYWANPDGVALWIEKLREDAPRNGDSAVLEWTQSILRVSPDDRLTAPQLRGLIADHRSNDPYICRSCSSQHGLRPPETGIMPESTATMPLTIPAVISIEPNEAPESDSSDPGSGSNLDESDDTDSVDTAEPSMTECDADVGFDIAIGGFHIPSKTDEINSTEELTSPSQGVAIDEFTGCVDGTPDNESDSPPPYEVIAAPTTTSERPTQMQVNPETRFILLPEDRRPEPLRQEEDVPDVSEEEFIHPEPVKPPSFVHQDPVPKATLVPSYILAGMNRFSQSELATPPGGTTVNLFVYGRLMFPSVLSAIAAQSTKGVYSYKWRRRLIPSSEDWCKADLSIRRASEIMTPARLMGYDRFRPRGLNCAVVQDANKVLRRRKMDCYDNLPSHMPGHTEGFLIVGLRPEALRYCDLLFGSDRRTMHTLRPQDDADRDDSDPDSDFVSTPLLKRCTVPVEVQTFAGEVATVVADTYVWAGRTSELVNIWEEERFLRSAPMQKVLEAQPTWAKEEQVLARIMKTSFALVGDYLVAPIQGGNKAELVKLLDSNIDPNAACRVYGRPLQAAVVAGRMDMVRLLLDYGAKVNTVGGQYGTPLIAATCTSRKAITKLLLQNGADVFVSDIVHVNALYQAVANGDYAVAEILLEHGAWLGRDWYETRDMAEERGGEDFQGLLDGYDVRKIHRQHVAAGCRHDRERENKNDARDDENIGTWDGVRYSKVTLAVVRKVAAVQGASGSWRGRRGVAVTVAALDAGAPLRLIGMLRKAVAPVQAIFEILRKGDEEQERKRLAGERLSAADREDSAKDVVGRNSDEIQEKQVSRRRKTDSLFRGIVEANEVEYGPHDIGRCDSQYSSMRSSKSPERQKRVRFVDPV